MTNVPLNSVVEITYTKDGHDNIRTGVLAAIYPTTIVLLKDDGKYGTYRKTDIHAYGVLKYAVCDSQ